MNTNTCEKIQVNEICDTDAIPGLAPAHISHSSPSLTPAAAPLTQPPADAWSIPTAPVSSQSSVDLARKLLPPSLRTRKFRADSFASKLTPAQLVTVIAWLQNEPVPNVRAKIAAPAPEGFGMKVHLQTLYRLRNMTSNTELNSWIANAMDATYDILIADTSVDTAPMREALSLLLHSRIMTYVREQTDPASIDRLVSALSRLEKLKTHIAQRPHLTSGPREKTTRHTVDVQITTNPGTPAPITIHATHQTLPNAKPRQIENETSEKNGEKL